MGVLDKLIEIVQKDPELEKKLQAGFRALLAGNVDPDSKLSVEARKDRMRVVVDQMTQAGFSDSFTDRHAYYGALIGMAASTAAVTQRGLIVEHLHVTGHHFYFPPSTSTLELVLKTHKETSDPVYAVMARGGQTQAPYEFIAFRIPDAFSGGIKGVRDTLTEIIRDEPNDGEGPVFAKWLDDEGFRPISLQGVGRSKAEERYYFLRVGRVSEALDFDQNRTEYEKLGWTLETVAMKLGGGAKASAAMKEGLEEALDFTF